MKSRVVSQLVKLISSLNFVSSNLSILAIVITEKQLIFGFEFVVYRILSRLNDSSAVLNYRGKWKNCQPLNLILENFIKGSYKLFLCRW